MLQAIIIDDEADGIANLTFYLRKLGGVNIIHTFCDAEAAIHYLNTHHVQVVFLDIHLKDRTGFDLLQQLSVQHFSLVFVTAYDQYALKAFKANAIDYILKPINEEELSSVLVRIKKYRTLNSFENPQNLKDNQQYVNIKEQGFLTKIATQNILYIEALGSYSKLFYLKQDKVTPVVVAKSIAQFESAIGTCEFFRTHKSYLVNIRYFKSIQVNPFSNIMLLEYGCSVKVSRRRLKELKSIFAALPPSN